MGSAEEEGSDVPGALMPGQPVDRTEAWGVWDLEQADREGTSKVTKRASHGISVCSSHAALSILICRSMAKHRLIWALQA